MSKFIARLRELAGPVSKAIVATVAPLIVGFAAKYGLDLDVDAVALILVAIITGGSVYAKANTDG